MKSYNELTHCAGLDWAGDHHDVAVVNATGKVMAEFRITSYGSYSGTVPNEKITWGKLGKATPKFIIESDAPIMAPLIFAEHVLAW